MLKEIVIPQTKEFGWEIVEGREDRIFKPTKKAIWSRIHYIAKQFDSKVEPNTTFFTVKNYSILSEEEVSQFKELLEKEVKLMESVIDPTETISLSSEGREEPNLDDLSLI